MDDAELLFLVWHSLSSGPLAEAARALEEQATRLGLLPSRVDIAGNVHQVSFEQYGRLHPHVPPDALQRLLQKLLEQSKASNANGGLQVVSLTAPGKHGLLGCEEPPLPHWWRRPHAQASLPHKLLLRQSGLAGIRLGMPSSANGSATATGLLCRQMRHLTTVRGHRLAVYCCTYDNTGRRVITGSDDYLVKIWSAETGTLIKSCRGHDAEITDFAVSCDNSMIASGDVAHSIRVWSLQEGTLGWPLAVLNGHTNVVSYLDFHPHLTDALLSCSTDGTCCIWSARDPGVAALVLRPSAVFGMMATDQGQGLYTSAEPEARETAGDAGCSPAEAARGGTGVDSATQIGASRGGSVDPVIGGGGGRAGSTRGSVPPTGPATGMFGSPPPTQHEEVAAMSPAAAAANPNRSPVGFLCCSWSPDGTFIFAGGTDCTVCVWHWDLTAPPAPPVAPAAQAHPNRAPLSHPAPQQFEPQLQAQKQEQQQQGVEGASHLAASPPATTATVAIASGSAAPLSRPVNVVGGAAAAVVGESISELFAGRDWPRPTELTKLSGHRNDIVFIEFSHEGTAVATASRDGCVKIWRLERDRRHGQRMNCWWEAMSLACPPTEEEIRKARLKRKPPPHPAINQVAWNLDDSRMVAAVTDNSVRVWDMASGTQTHILLEHSAQAHVLEAHPQDPRLVMSGGYDGRTILWDVVAGVALRMFSTQDTFPGRGRWTDPLQLVDGHFAPDGAQLAVTDTAGQLHLYGVPVVAAVEVMARAPYDQFLASDYNGLVRDVNGWVLDELTQQPPHLMTRQTLCDYSNHPYPIEVQAAFVARRLGDLPRPHPVDRDHPLPPALLAHPPTLVSASWLAVENGASAAAVQQAMNRAYERHMQALTALSRTDDALPSRGGRRSSVPRNGGAAAGGGSGGAGRAGSEPPRRPISGAAQSGGAAAAANIPRGAYLIIDDPTAPPPQLLLSMWYNSDDSNRRGELTSSSSSDYNDDDDDADVASMSDPGGSGSSDDSDDDGDPVLLVDSDDGRPFTGRSGRVGSGGPVARGRSRSGGGGASAASQGDGPTLRRSSRRERAEAREQAQQERIRRSARLSGHKRRYGDGDDAPDSYGTDDELQLLNEQLEDEEYGDTGGEEEEPDDDDSGDDDEARRRQRRAAAYRRQRERERERRAARRAQRELRNQQRREQRREERRRQIAAATAATAAAGDDTRALALGLGAADSADAAATGGATAGHGALEAAVEEAQILGPQRLHQVARKRSHEAGGSRPRALDAYSWLQCTAYVPDFYCPQLGDEVVYVRSGHEAYLESINDKRASRPWRQLPGMRATEPCFVTELSFEILRDGAYRTAANLKLTVDPASDSPVAGEVFSLQLPPPAPPDQQRMEFLVPLPRFSRAVAKRWRIGERCKTYQSVNGTAAGEGCWYGATVVVDRVYPDLTSAAGEAPPLRQPHDCEALWERYGVLWDGEAETIYISPWDMLPMTSSWDEVVRYARATAAAKADEIVAAAAAAAASKDDGGDDGAGPSMSLNRCGGGGGIEVSERHLDIGGGWAEEQASAARLALERLFVEERLYSLFLHCPPPSATYPCFDGDRRPVPYNAVVPLPMSLEVIEQRLENSFYRSLAAVRHDMDTIVANAERFNGADSAVAQRARDMQMHFIAAISGRCVDDVLLFGPGVIVRRRRRRPAAPPRRRADLSRLWMHIALDLEDAPATAAEADGADAAALMVERVKPGRRWTGADAIRGGTNAAGGVTGPRRRGGLWIPSQSAALSSLPGAAAVTGGGSSAAVVDNGHTWPMDANRGMATMTSVAPESWAEGTGGGGGSGDGTTRAARGRLNPSRNTGGAQRQQRQRGKQQDSDNDFEGENEDEGDGGRLAVPSGRGRRQQQQRRRQPQQQAPSRPRRERANAAPGRFTMLYGSEDSDDDEALAAAEDSDSDADGQEQEETSDSDSNKRGRRRRQPSQRGQGRRQRQSQRQQQPLRRSSRARHRTRYGSDWEDEVPDQVEDDSDSGDEDGGGVATGVDNDSRKKAGRRGGGGGAIWGRPVDTRTTANTAPEVMTGLSAGNVAEVKVPLPPQPLATVPLRTGAPTTAQPPQQHHLRGPEAGIGLHSADAEGSEMGAAVAAAEGDPEDVRLDGLGNRASLGVQGRLKIRLRAAAADGSRIIVAAAPAAEVPSSSTILVATPPVASRVVYGSSSGGNCVDEMEDVAGRQGLRMPQRGISAPVPAPPPPLPDGGRSRRAAAVPAVAAVAAGATRAHEDAISDESDDGDHTLQRTLQPKQRHHGPMDSACVGVSGPAAAAAAAAADDDGGNSGAAPFLGEKSQPSGGITNSYGMVGQYYHQHHQPTAGAAAAAASLPQARIPPSQQLLRPGPGPAGGSLNYPFGPRAPSSGVSRSPPPSRPSETASPWLEASATGVMGLGLPEMFVSRHRANPPVTESHQMHQVGADAYQPYNIPARSNNRVRMEDRDVGTAAVVTAGMSQAALAVPDLSNATLAAAAEALLASMMQQGGARSGGPASRGARAQSSMALATTSPGGLEGMFMDGRTDYKLVGSGGGGCSGGVGPQRMSVGAAAVPSTETHMGGPVSYMQAAGRLPGAPSPSISPPQQPLQLQAQLQQLHAIHPTQSALRHQASQQQQQQYQQYHQQPRQRRPYQQQLQPQQQQQLRDWVATTPGSSTLHSLYDSRGLLPGISGVIDSATHGMDTRVDLNRLPHDSLDGGRGNAGNDPGMARQDVAPYHDLPTSLRLSSQGFSSGKN